MITSIRIENLRGIRDGTLEALTPLVVLVGPNGAGKSTILDALLIGAGRRPAACVGYVVERRSGLRHGARWLLHRGGEGMGQLDLGFADGSRRRSALAWSAEDGVAPALRRHLQGKDGPYSEIEVTISPSGSSGACVFSAKNEYFAEEIPEVNAERSTAWLVDPRLGTTLHDLYSRVAEHGRRQALLDLVVPLVPGLRLVEVLTEHGDPRLNLTFDDRSIPVALAGDGIQSLVRLALELATRREKTILLEEPEAHQHPAAIRASAQAIVAGIRSGRQIVLSTHSMELVDALIDALGDQELPKLTLFRVKLNDGILLRSRLEGPDVLAMRQDIAEDLR